MDYKTYLTAILAQANPDDGNKRSPDPYDLARRSFPVEEWLGSFGAERVVQVDAGSGDLLLIEGGQAIHVMFTPLGNFLGSYIHFFPERGLAAIERALALGISRFSGGDDWSNVRLREFQGQVREALETNTLPFKTGWDTSFLQAPLLMRPIYSMKTNDAGRLQRIRELCGVLELEIVDDYIPKLSAVMPREYWSKYLERFDR